jgi:predicted nucleic acid-binding protein
LYIPQQEESVDVVVDASAVIAVIANEPKRDTLIELTRGADLIAPHSVHWEIGNAFSAMLKRKRATVEQVLASAAAYRQIPIRYVDVELEESLRIADALGIYAYDAYLIRCAQKYDAPLLTLDRSIVECARRIDAPVIEVVG